MEGVPWGAIRRAVVGIPRGAVRGMVWRAPKGAARGSSGGAIGGVSYRAMLVSSWGSPVAHSGGWGAPVRATAGEHW